MRKILLSLLLASVAATPAVAGPRDDNDRKAERAERQQARQESHQERQQARPERAERPQFNGQQNMNAGNAGARPQVSEQRRFDGGNAGVQTQFVRRGQIRQNLETVQQNAVQPNNQRDWRTRQPTGDQRLRQYDRPVPNVIRTHNRTPVVSDVPRRGTQPPLRVDNRRHDNVRWNTNWRHDDRYDWRRWRDHHHSSFHFGAYFDPFGWGYQRYSIGWRLWPSYYGSNFWINDPWQYRLPYAPPGYQWVRYYDDALLVDTWNGQVVDVIYSFFW